MSSSDQGLVSGNFRWHATEYFAGTYLPEWCMALTGRCPGLWDVFLAGIALSMPSLPLMIAWRRFERAPVARLKDWLQAMGITVDVAGGRCPGGGLDLAWAASWMREVPRRRSGVVFVDRRLLYDVSRSRFGRAFLRRFLVVQGARSRWLKPVSASAVGRILRLRPAPSAPVPEVGRLRLSVATSVTRAHAGVLGGAILRVLRARVCTDADRRMIAAIYERSEPVAFRFVPWVRRRLLYGEGATPPTP